MQNFKKTKAKRGKILPSRLLYLVPLSVLAMLLFLGASALAKPTATSLSVLADAPTSAAQSDPTVSEAPPVPNVPNIPNAPNASGAVAVNGEVYPSGDIFGVKFFTEGVMITDCGEVETEEGIISPAEKAGLRKGDILCKIDGSCVNTAEELVEKVASSNGRPLSIAYQHEGMEKNTLLTPVKSSEDGKYKAGLWVSDSTAGLGTITYYDASDGRFAGLGHGIYDTGTEQLLPLRRGAVVEVTLNGILKGREKSPGELKGDFSDKKSGNLLQNTPSGVTGFLSKPPQTPHGAMKLADKSEVSVGKATILCRVTGDTVEEYDVMIEKIYGGSEKTKNFVLRVTDERLLALTGGIVRGMSGSPILQNDKLIGAVTHVLVSDPQKGYGIFIENMPKAAPSAKAA